MRLFQHNCHMHHSRSYRIIVVGTERRLCHLGQILHIFTSITFILCYRFVSLCIMSHPRSNIHVFRVQREYVYVCIWKCNSLQENSEQELPEARKELLTRKSVNQFTGKQFWKLVADLKQQPDSPKLEPKFLILKPSLSKSLGIIPVNLPELSKVPIIYWIHYRASSVNVIYIGVPN